jgi:hypothetical protein
MKQVIFGCIFASLLLAQPASQMNGKWMGTLEAGPQRLRLALDVENGEGAMISIDQGSARVPIKKIEENQANVKIDFGMATYDGAMDGAGKQISGTYHQSGMNFPLVFKRVDKIEEPRRPQNPQRPFPYAEEEVTFKGGGGVGLAGTLTYPKTGAPFAAVLLLTGSGRIAMKRSWVTARSSSCPTISPVWASRFCVSMTAGWGNRAAISARRLTKIRSPTLSRESICSGTARRSTDGESACLGIVKAERSPN